MKAFIFKITFHADAELISSISDQLIEVGFKPIAKLIRKVIEDKTYYSGDGFIVEPTLYDKYDEDDKQNFINCYKDLGFKLKK